MDPDPDPLVRAMDPDPAPDPLCKNSKKNLDFYLDFYLDFVTNRTEASMQDVTVAILQSTKVESSLPLF